MTDRPDRPTRLALRLLGVLAAALLLLALVLAISRDRTPEAEPVTLGTTPQATGPSGQEATTAPSRSPNVVVDPAALDSPSAAEAAGAAVVLATADHAVAADWSDLVDPIWHDRVAEPGRPAYVGRLDLDGDHVTGDVAIALVSDGLDVVRLRFLPAAAVLQDAGADTMVEAAIDGTVASVEVDAAGALLVVDDAVGHAPGEPMLVRVIFDYRVPTRSQISDDGGPAGFGLITSSPGITMIGHGFPVLTFDDSPMVAWGDVGAFPTARWSVRVHADGVVVTGGDDGPCPETEPEDGSQPCTWARGPALRDLAVAVFEGATSAADGEVVVTGRDTLGQSRVDRVLLETVDSMTSIEQRIGPLAWQEVDVVLAPLRSAAGMEFPGLVIVDPEYLDRLNGGFGTYVIAHEAAHQWFHALVGNSSLLDAVVDESLAQYASLWYYRDHLSEAAADGVVDRYFAGRYRNAKSDGIADRAPASALASFDGDRQYGPMTYARAPFAWLVAERETSEQEVVDFLAELVERHGLGVVTAVDVRELAGDRFPSITSSIDRWWFDPAPVEAEIP